MELILLGIYSFIVWLIFFKFKLLPWNITSQVIVITLPIIGLTAMILLLNVFAPSSADVRVVNYTVQVIPQVTGRVIEVPVEGNQTVKKGDVLFRIDPVPFQEAVRTAEAKVLELKAKLVGVQNKEKELQELQKITKSRVASVKANLDLAAKRSVQYEQLLAKGAGRLFDVEQSETNKISLEADLDGALARDADITFQLAARMENGELAEIAVVRASLAAAESQLANTKWQLEQTTVYAPADATVINLQLRVGQFVNNMPFKPALVLVEKEQQVIALFKQNELHQVKAGQEAEISLRTSPGTIVKCTVDSIVWAQGQGQLPWSGTVPDTGFAPNPDGRFAVKLNPTDKAIFLAAGARGDGAIYTDGGKILHVIRKVIMRVGTKTDALILKLH